MVIRGLALLPYPPFDEVKQKWDPRSSMLKYKADLHMNCTNYCWLAICLTCFQLPNLVYGETAVDEKLVLQLTFVYRNETSRHFREVRGQKNHAVAASYAHAAAARMGKDWHAGRTTERWCLATG